MKKLSYLLSLCLTLAFASANAQCWADYYYTVNGLTVTFVDSSYSNTGSFTSDWDFGDGNTSTAVSPSHTFSKGGTYYVCLDIGDNARCTSQRCDSITVVDPSCTADFSYTVSNSTDVSFTNLTTPAGSVTLGYDYSWDFGDGNTDTLENPNHTYDSAGLYLVTLTAINTNGDTCTAVDTIDIELTCRAHFTISKDTASAFNVILTNNSSNESSHVYSWDFGDGNTSSSRNPSHSYANFGLYEVCLTITDSVLRCTPAVFCDTVGMDSLGNLKAGFGITVQDPVIVGIDKHNDDFAGLSIYPNPANSILNVDLRGIKTSLNVRVLDLSGRVILEENNKVGGNVASFDISQLSKGIYFMLLDNGSNQKVEKFIVSD